MDMKDLPKAYEASSIEADIYKKWEDSGAFDPDKLADLDPRYKDAEPYCIIMPPPNVTGILHLGHAMENALIDAMIRFQRMRGKKTLLLPGTDHASIATQAKVEKMLMEQGIKQPRVELGREKLVEKIREFAETSRATMLNQIRLIGTSCDWSRLAYTLDDARNRSVNELFTRMHQDGLIYRGYRVVNWTVKGQSTCSDDEIVYIERAAKLYTFKYSKDFPIVISTTRPETKLGDTAVAVHPMDKRYQDFVGKTYTVDVGAAKPLSIKVITDENVDPNFGTGALGVTPAHSSVDFTMYEKQKAKGDPIGIVPVIDINGKMTEEAGETYVGLSVEDAREKFVTWLNSQDLLINEEEIIQSVGTSDRYGDVIESIPMTQWWLDVNKQIPGRGKTLRDLLREAVTTGLDGDAEQKVSIMPERIVKEYLDRVENLRDWCLSRQLWWGHRIPVWYKGDEVLVDAKAPNGDGWEQDPDTLDTWFSSGMWTFSTLGWPEETTDLKTFHPTNWMQMGYEIRYLWLMRMILMSVYALKEVPFKDAYIHGILRDEHGKKFSKSSGNGIDPVEVVKEYGCDALRISLLFGVAPGNDSRYYTEKIESGRNFTNKLWNISRFVMQSTWSTSKEEADRQWASEKTLADWWILTKYYEVQNHVTQLLEQYQFSQAGEILRDFTWGDFADWYLEVSKIEKNKDAMLWHILPRLLKLWHPFMPFVTEYIWKVGKMDERSLIVSEWPSGEMKDEGAVKDFEQVKNLITDLRRLRSENGVEPVKLVDFSIVADEAVRRLIEGNMEVVKAMSRAQSITFVESIAEGWATAVSGTMTIGLDLAGTIDVAVEKAKMQKEVDGLRPYITSTAAKLQNKDFTSKAPEKVVADMQAKLDEAKSKLKALEERLTSLG